LEEQSFDLGVPRISIGMEGVGGGRLDGPAKEPQNAMPAGADPVRRKSPTPSGTSAQGASPDPG
jgi:hypothetical protein